MDKTKEYVRDEKSGALINADNEALANYKKRRKANRDSASRLNTLEERMERIENLLLKLTKEN